jgi:hypothetical protein
MSLAAIDLVAMAILLGLPGSQAKYSLGTRENMLSSARDLTYDLM